MPPSDLSLTVHTILGVSSLGSQGPLSQVLFLSLTRSQYSVPLSAALLADVVLQLVRQLCANANMPTITVDKAALFQALGQK